MYSSYLRKSRKRRRNRKRQSRTPDADYVDDGYDPEFEDNDADSSVDEDDNEPV